MQKYEFRRQAVEEWSEGGEKYGMPNEVCHWLWRRVFEGEAREVCVVLYLDTALHNIGWHVQAIGSATSCPLVPAEVFRGAILAGATGIIVAHNHPSGQTKPSPSDCAVWDKIKAAGDMLGIRAVDSLIVAGENKFYSFVGGE